MAATERERILASALRAALRWPYKWDMIDHIKGAKIDKFFDPTYVVDITAIKAGVAAARELGELVIVED